MISQHCGCWWPDALATEHQQSQWRGLIGTCGTSAGPWFIIKTLSYQHRKSHCGDKTILQPSYLHNEISYTGKMTSLYWIGALELVIPQFELFSGGHPRKVPIKPLCQIQLPELEGKVSEFCGDVCMKCFNHLKVKIRSWCFQFLPRIYSRQYWYLVVGVGSLSYCWCEDLFAGQFLFNSSWPGVAYMRHEKQPSFP